MGTRSGVFAVAVLLLSPLVTRADAGLPRFAAPDWSSLSTPQWAAVSLSLSLTLGWLGIWAFKRPFAASGMLLWVVGLPSLLIGVFTILFALGFHAYLALPLAGIPLVVAVLSGLAGYKEVIVRSRMIGNGPGFASVALGLALSSAAFAGLAPRAFSIATVFLFAGPHNWIEDRYFLSRLPGRWGPLLSDHS
jgi:hypothetical protein